MIDIYCDAEECIYNSGDGKCNRAGITLSNRGTGIPECLDFEKEEE